MPGGGGAPLGLEGFLDCRAVRTPGGVQQIAVGPMLQRMTPRIPPVVENLAAQQVASNAPFVMPASFFQPIVASHQIVEIRDLVSSVIETGFAGAQQKHGVMVTRNRSAIAAQKRAEHLGGRAEIDLI